MEDAERIKKRYGCALASLVTEDDPIEVPTVGGRAPKILSKHELTNILEPRAAEIAKLVLSRHRESGIGQRDPQRRGRRRRRRGDGRDGGNGRAGVSISRRGKGVPRGLSGLSDTVAGPEWAAAAGLLLWGFRDRARVRKRPRRGFARIADGLKSLFTQT